MNKNAPHERRAEALVRAIGNNRLEKLETTSIVHRWACWAVTAGVRSKRPCTICLAAQDLPCFRAELSWGNADTQDLPQAHLHTADSRCAAAG